MKRNIVNNIIYPKVGLTCKIGFLFFYIDKLTEGISLKNKDNELLTNKTYYCKLDL